MRYACKICLTKYEPPVRTYPTVKKISKHIRDVHGIPEQAIWIVIMEIETAAAAEPHTDGL